MTWLVAFLGGGNSGGAARLAIFSQQGLQSVWVEASHRDPVDEHHGWQEKPAIEKLLQCLAVARHISEFIGDTTLGKPRFHYATGGSALVRVDHHFFVGHRCVLAWCSGQKG